MKKKYILQKNYDIEQVLSSKKVIKSLHFRLYVKKKQNLKTGRIAILVGKKNGNAVERNKIKRQIKAILQHQIKTLPNKQYALIYMAKKNEKITFIQKKQEIEKILKGIK